jgi:hypothetical protein
MIHENSEMNGRGAKPPLLNSLPSSLPSSRSSPRPGPEPKPEPGLNIDLKRLVWDPEYREQMRRRLKRPG